MHLLRVHAILCTALGVVFACAPAISAAASRDKKKPSGHEKTVWNYESGVFFATDGSILEGPCFRLSGRLTAPNFFENVKRVDTDDGTIFRRGKEILTQFPKRVRLEFIVYDMACPSQLEQIGHRLYLSREMMSTVHLYLYWKRGVELRPVVKPVLDFFNVQPMVPYDTVAADDIPERFQWSYVYDISSGGVPLTDSLVLILRTHDGRMAARVAARM